MSYWRVFRRPICLTYRYLVFYVECEAFSGRNESFPTSFPEVATTRLLFPRLRRKLLFSGFLSFVVKYSLHIRVIMSAVCVPADRTYSSSNTFSITTGRGSWNARFNFSPVQLERQQTKNNQKSKPTNVCRTFLEREARGCDFLITRDAIARLSASVTTVLFVLYGLVSRLLSCSRERHWESGVSKLNDLSNKDVFNVGNIWKFW